MKKITNALTMGVLMSAMCFSANANMVTSGAVLESNDFSTLSTAWNPGVDTARVGGNAAAGGATWSIMGSGHSDAAGDDPHGGASTSFMTALPGLSGLVSDADIAIVMKNAIDLWANVSDFTNLGQVADGNADIGASDAAGGNLGDIRIGAIFIDGNVGGNVLAHAYQPGNDSIFLNGNIAGDVHFDDGNSWFISGGAGLGVDNIGTGSIDLYTVAIHEIGHALGMGHSGVVGSIMEPVYAGIRQSLSADDIAGIQSIYGNTTVVPVPGALVLFLSGGLGMIGLVRRKRVVK